MKTPQDIFQFNKFNSHDLLFYKSSAQCNEKYFSVADELIKNLFCQMCKASTKYVNDVFCDLPYLYRERSLDSVLLPALSKLCNTHVLVEYPMLRRPSRKYFSFKGRTKDDSNGRIDYWCVYKGYSFIIEIKHAYDCFLTDTTRYKGVVQQWEKANEQLETIIGDVKEYGEATKGVIRVALMVITSYSDKEPNRELVSAFRDKIPVIGTRFMSSVCGLKKSISPDIAICWQIPENIVTQETSTYPGLWALAKVYEPVKHKGAVK